MRLFVFILGATLFFNTYAKEVSIDQVKTAYVYNFIKHTNWPNESTFNQYHILVVSKNDNLKNMFSMLSSRKLLNEKKIKVTFYDGKNPIKNIQAVYVDELSANLYEKLFNEYEKSDVLFISDGYKDKQKVMINLVQNDQMVTFEINKANILNRSLKVSPDLVLLGGSEIDVAKLYKTSQSELKEQKETIATLSTKIQEKNNELAEKIVAITKQKEALGEQKATLDIQNNLLSAQLQSIDNQNKTIVSQQNELDSIHQNIARQKEKLAIEEDNIAQKEADYKRLVLALQTKQIELNRLTDEVEEQKEKLVQKEGVITTQKGALALLSLLLGTIVILGLYVFKQNRQLNALSRTDSLTGLLNRRVVMEYLDQEIQKYHRYGTIFSILFIDVDHFKQINDKYGHDKGDLVLKTIAKLMSQYTRDTDICVRWGGEEFIILAVNTNLENSVNLAENLRSTIADHDFDLGNRVTISIGVASIQPNLDKDSLVKIADDALYLAKEKGRNNVQVGTLET